MERKFFCFAILFFCAGLTGCFVTTKKYNLKNEEALQTKAAADELDRKLAAATDEKQKLDAEMVVVKKNLEDMGENNKNLLSTLEAKKTEKDKMIADLTRSKQSLESQKVDLESQVSTLNQKMDAISREKEAAIANLKITYDNLVKDMETEIKGGEILITQLQDKLSVNLVDKILFSSGESIVKKDGQKILTRVGDILKKIENKQIRIEGHTDNVPIGKELEYRFPTNWELSSARATNVARYLIEKVGIDPKRISVVGYADQRPIGVNTTVAGRSRNRRIEIVLIPIDIDRVVVPPQGGTVSGAAPQEK